MTADLTSCNPLLAQKIESERLAATWAACEAVRAQMSMRLNLARTLAALSRKLVPVRK